MSRKCATVDIVGADKLTEISEEKIDWTQCIKPESKYVILKPKDEPSRNWLIVPIYDFPKLYSKVETLIKDRPQYRMFEGLCNWNYIIESIVINNKNQDNCDFCSNSLETSYVMIESCNQSHSVLTQTRIHLDCSSFLNTTANKIWKENSSQLFLDAVQPYKVDST